MLKWFLLHESQHSCFYYQLNSDFKSIILGRRDILQRPRLFKGSFLRSNSYPDVEKTVINSPLNICIWKLSDMTSLAATESSSKASHVWHIC